MMVEQGDTTGDTNEHEPGTVIGVATIRYVGRGKPLPYPDDPDDPIDRAYQAAADLIDAALAYAEADDAAGDAIEACQWDAAPATSERREDALTVLLDAAHHYAGFVKRA